MKLVTPEQMRDLDRRTIEEYGTPGEMLMERAGYGVAEIVRRLADSTGFVNPHIQLFAGRGNNGGDAFVTARFLKEWDCQVEVWLAASVQDLKGDALKHFSKMSNAGVSHRELPTKDDWDEALDCMPGGEVLVDGVLGIGVSGPARDPAAGAIQYINSRARDGFVVSIDIPSGLDANTGEPLGETVRADVTATMGLPKCGMVGLEARDFVGSLEVVDIGIPWEFVEETDCDTELELNYVTDLKSLFPRRDRNSHKGNFGHVLLIGGAVGYAGAISMAARAAVRSGVGLVTSLVPENIRDIVAGQSLETMVYAARETPDGSLSAELWPDWRNRLDIYDAILIGPGMTRNNDTLLLVREFLRESTKPIVVDADAIAVLAHQPDWLTKANCPVIITPHPGELAMLFGPHVSEVQENREGMALAAAKYTNATVVLKGAGTIIAQTEHPCIVNLTGNPGMATGGMGDVLGGLIVGLVAQGLTPYDASRAGVYIHGRAGDQVAMRASQAGLSATDLIDEIPFVFRDLCLR